MRPALTRAMAVYATDPKAREVMSGLVMKGQDIFRARRHRGARRLQGHLRAEANHRGRQARRPSSG